MKVVDWRHGQTEETEQRAQTISERRDRCGVGHAGAARARRQAGWTASALSRREIVNGVLYIVRTSSQWRALPHDLPLWQTVYYYFRQWRNAGVWEQIPTALREQTRRHLGRAATPSPAILDSRSVKTSQKGGRAASTRTSR